MLRILMIEDDEDFLSVLRDAVVELDPKHEVQTTKDGLRAYLLARTQESDVILADYHLPSMSGFELIEGLRKHVKRPSTPIIIVTGNPDLAREELKGYPNIEIIEKFEAIEKVPERLQVLDREFCRDRTAKTGTNENPCTPPESSVDSEDLAFHEISEHLQSILAGYLPDVQPQLGALQSARDFLQGISIKNRYLATLEFEDPISGKQLLAVAADQTSLHYLNPRTKPHLTLMEFCTIMPRMLLSSPGRKLLQEPKLITEMGASLFPYREGHAAKLILVSGPPEVAIWLMHVAERISPCQAS